MKTRIKLDLRKGKLDLLFRTGIVLLYLIPIFGILFIVENKLYVLLFLLVILLTIEIEIRYREYFYHKRLFENKVSEIYYSPNKFNTFLKKKLFFQVEYSNSLRRYTIKSDLFDKSFSCKSHDDFHKQFKKYLRELMTQEEEIIESKILDSIDKEKYLRFLLIKNNTFYIYI